MLGWQPGSHRYNATLQDKGMPAMPVNRPAEAHGQLDRGINATGYT